MSSGTLRSVIEYGLAFTVGFKLLNCRNGRSAADVSPAIVSRPLLRIVRRRRRTKRLAIDDVQFLR